MGIVVGLVLFFFVAKPGKIRISLRHEAANPPTAHPGQEAAPGEPGDRTADHLASVHEATAPQERGSPTPESPPSPGMPVVDLPKDADGFDLAGVELPQLPYCIYTGAYKDFQEAATTRSELDSNYLSAYIVPVEVKGNVAQSLFGVTNDGLWYRVLTGHFASKEEARKTLGTMMKELPGFQPEIMKFDYSLECGRFLEADEARLLLDRLDKEAMFPYSQTYPTSDGRALTRVLVGCYFSEQGAENEQGPLRDKGFSCTVAER